MKYERRTEDDCSHKPVEDERANEIAAEFVPGTGITTVLELGSYGRVLTFGSAG